MDWGSFLGGAADGLSQGEKNVGQRQKNKMDNLAYQDALTQQAANQAVMNAIYPGSKPIPSPQQQGGLPSLAQAPVIGPLGNALGLWQQPAERPGIPQQGVAGPQPPTTTQRGVPTPATPQPTFQPDMQPQQIAILVDRANPGLRQTNPQAFVAAVQLAQQQMQQMRMGNLDTAYKGAQVKELGARGELEQAHGDYYRGGANTTQAGNKALLSMYHETETNIRNLQTQRSKIATDWSMNKNEKASMLQQLDQQISGLSARRDILTKQMRGEESTEPAKATETQKEAVRQSGLTTKMPKAMLTEAQTRYKADKNWLSKKIISFREAGISDDSIAEFARAVRGE
jgi:hypothetical protein